MEGGGKERGLGMVGGGRRHGGRMRWEIEGRYMERDKSWRKGKRLGGSDEA